MQTTHRKLDPQELLARHRAFARRAEKALREGASKDIGTAAMLAWFESYDCSQEALMDWLIRENVYQTQLEAIKAKYEGGILQYLKRAFRDECLRLLGKSATGRITQDA